MVFFVLMDTDYMDAAVNMLPNLRNKSTQNLYSGNETHLSLKFKYTSCVPRMGYQEFLKSVVVTDTMDIKVNYF